MRGPPGSIRDASVHPRYDQRVAHSQLAIDESATSVQSIRWSIYLAHLPDYLAELQSGSVPRSANIFGHALTINAISNDCRHRPAIDPNQATGLLCYLGDPVDE